MWKEETLKEVENQPLAYNEDGEVFYIKDIVNGDYERLKYLGYDKQRKCLRYGFKYNQTCKVYRIPINIDRLDQDGFFYPEFGFKKFGR